MLLARSYLLTFAFEPHYSCLCFMFISGKKQCCWKFQCCFQFYFKKKKKKKQSGLVTSANNNINFCQRLHGNTDKLHFAISPTDKLGKSISTTACPHSTVNSTACQRSRTPPPPLLLDFWHQTWISISLRSPKTICPVSLLLTGRCSQKQKRVDPSLPSLPSLGI